MDVQKALQSLRRGEKFEWPTSVESLDFAQSLDANQDLVCLRNDFIIPTKSQLQSGSMIGNVNDREDIDNGANASIYFCGNSLGLQPQAVSSYLATYLKTWGSIAVHGHFRSFEDSPLVPYQDMAAQCSRQMANIVGASMEEIVVMNTLTVNLHLMMAAFYRPTEKKHKIMAEWRPFPSDYYAIESQIQWHGRYPRESMLLIEPDEGTYLISTSKVISLIDDHAHELALILLPGIQYYSGQLLDIPAITKHAHSHNVTIGWDLAHAAGNVELQLHDWDVDFACWCTYKYMNAGAGAIAGAFVHSKHGTVSDNRGLKGWYGGDKSVRFLMDNKFVPTPGAQGFQLSNPSAVDLTCLSASLSVFNKTTMTDLRSRSLLLTAYAEHLLDQILLQTGQDEAPFRIITPRDPRMRGAQLSVLIREDLMDGVSSSLETGGIVCDKRKPDCIRIAPVPLYNTFSDVWQFMQVFGKAVRQAGTVEVAAHPSVEARL